MKTCHYRIAILVGVVLLTPVRQGGALAERVSADNASADASALLVSAQHQFGLGNYLAAIATLRSVVLENPLSAEAFYWLGRCYYEIRDFDNAIAHAEKSVALQPQNSVYQDFLGRAYGGKADREKSFFTARKVKKQFEQAVRLDPSNIPARRDLQEFCMEAPWIVGGNSEQARAQVDAITQIDPLQGHLARAAFDVESLKRLDLAEKEYIEVLEAKPSTSDPYFEVASFFQSENKPGEMKSAVEAAALVNPNDPRLAFYRAVGIILAGTDLGRAEEYLKSYLASTPDRSDWPPHAAAREWLGRLYEAQGKRAEAAEQYRASLQLDQERNSARARLEKLEKPAK